MAAEGAAETPAAAAGDAGDNSGTGFYNRRSHNYPLIKVKKNSCERD